MESSSPYRAAPDLSTQLVVVHRSWATFGVWLLIMAAVGITGSLWPYRPGYLVTAVPPTVLGLWLLSIRLRVLHDKAKDAFVIETLRWPLPRSQHTTPLADIVDVVVDEGARRHIAVAFQLREGLALITTPESGFGESRIRKLQAKLAAYLADVRRGA